MISALSETYVESKNMRKVVGISYIGIFFKSLPATFLRGSTNDAIRLNQGATKPPLLLVTDKLPHVAHQLLVLLGPDAQLLQPGDVLLEVLAALLWYALLVPPACIIRHIEQWRRKVEVIIQEILNGQFRCCVGKEEKGNKAEGMHDKRHWSRVSGQQKERYAAGRCFISGQVLHPEICWSLGFPRSPCMLPNAHEQYPIAKN